MPQDHQTLTRRERQIMDVLYRRGRATAAEVREHLPDAPSYSAVRALLRILENKGLYPARKTTDPGMSSFQRCLEIARSSPLLNIFFRRFFEGSAEQAVAALLDSSSSQLSRDELDRLARMIKSARKEADDRKRGGKR